MNDEEAIRRCQDGDGEAFRHVVERYKGVLYGTAYLMTSDRAVAEDQVQEAFISAWRGIGGFQAGRPVKPWLVRILVNKVLSYRRRGSLASAPLNELSPGNTAGAGGQAEDLERRDQLRRALSGLSEEHRRVVMLRYFTELSVTEISTVLRCREGTVKSRLHRALEHLRRAISEA